MKEGRDKEVRKGSDGIHRLEKTQSKTIVFYKNGVQLEGFPVFYYGSHDALALLADILDGYFPRQLEKSFPDGTLLSMTDRIDTMYSSNQTLEELVNKIPATAIINDKIVDLRRNVDNFARFGSVQY